MSEAKTLSDKLKAAPVTATASGRTLLANNNGGIENINPSVFAQCVSFSPSIGEVYRIRNIESVLVACRGRFGGQSALIWVSSYGNGTPQRTQCKSTYNDVAYEWYINGASESTASLYLRMTRSNGDTAVVTSLLGQCPIVEKVEALPSDATPLSFT